MYCAASGIWQWGCGEITAFPQYVLRYVGNHNYILGTNVISGQVPLVPACPDLGYAG